MHRSDAAKTGDFQAQRFCARRRLLRQRADGIKDCAYGGSECRAQKSSTIHGGPPISDEAYHGALRTMVRPEACPTYFAATSSSVLVIIRKPLSSDSMGTRSSLPCRP